MIETNSMITNIETNYLTRNNRKWYEIEKIL